MKKIRSIKQVYQSFSSSGRNVRWPRRMPSRGEYADGTKDRRQTVALRFLLDAVNVIMDQNRAKNYFIYSETNLLSEILPQLLENDDNCQIPSAFLLRNRQNN